MEVGNEDIVWHARFADDISLGFVESLEGGQDEVVWDSQG